MVPEACLFHLRVERDCKQFFITKCDETATQERNTLRTVSADCFFFFFVLSTSSDRDCSDRVSFSSRLFSHLLRSGNCLKRQRGSSSPRVLERCTRKLSDWSGARRSFEKEEGVRSGEADLACRWHRRRRFSAGNRLFDLRGSNCAGPPPFSLSAYSFEKLSFSSSLLFFPQVA